MLIDWFTVGAQVLNFVLLMWLMKRFLYQPILDAIDAREKRIADELADAGRKQADALQERDAFQKKNDALDQQRDALLRQAKADADIERKRLIDAARAAADALAAKRQASLAREANALVQAVGQRAQAEVFAIARQTLTELAGVSLEASACDVFIARLTVLEGVPRDALVAALRGTHDDVLVRSAFALPDAQRLAMANAIADSFDLKPVLRFEVDPALVAGIELTAHGQKFAWSIGDHLASLERGVGEWLAARIREPAAAAPLPASQPQSPVKIAAVGAP